MELWLLRELGLESRDQLVNGWAVTWIGHQRPEVSQVHLAYSTEDRIDKKSFLAINNCLTAVQIIVCSHWVVRGFGVRLVPRSGRQHTGAILQ
jgi:hypothetical protein